MRKIVSSVLFLILITAPNIYALPLWQDGTILDAYTVVDNEGNWYSGDSPENYDSDFAGYLGDSWTGYYIGTVIDPKNDSPADISSLMQYYGNILITTVSKLDAPDTENGLLEVEYGESLLSGTWTVTGANGTSVISVKASTGWALYYIPVPTLSGIWTTEHLLNGGGELPDISHLSAGLAESTPVPEPATMLLLGTGLVGLAGASRKKIFQRG